MDLVRTRLVIPSRRPGWLPRPRLVARLQSATALVLVQAPAGYGKTTLLSEWARARRPAAWVSLEEGDNDPARLIAALMAAMAGATGVGERAASVADLVDALSARDRFLVVLDDAHLLTSRPTLELLTALVERLPEGAILALGSRAGPDLAWARWRARSGLLELGPADLRLSPEEAADVVARLGGPRLGREDATLLDGRVEGWAAGVALAAQALASRAQTSGQVGVSAYLRDVRSAHRWALDFLLEEVLRRRPAADQDLLMRTSVLERVSAPLAAYLSDDADARERFESLTRDGLFLLPADERGEWFRYHALFAEMLRLRLRQKHPGLEALLRKKAAIRLEADGDPGAAVEQHLQVGQMEEAARIVETVAEDMLARGEVETFLGWTDRLPPPLVARRSGLGVRRALCLFLQGRGLAEIEGALRTAVPDRDAGLVHALLALYRGDLAGAEVWAARAAQGEGTTAEFARIALAAIRRDLDGDRAARPLLEETARSRNPFGATMALAFLASLEARVGNLDHARSLLTRALDLAVDAKGTRLPVAGRCLVALGYLALERDELDEAERLLKEGLALGEITMRGASSGVYTILARVWAARGGWDEAEHLLVRARDRARAFDVTDEDDRQVEMAAAEVALARGDLVAASAWADEQVLTFRTTLSGRRSAKYEALVAARIYVAAGRATEALELIDTLIALPILEERPLLRAEAQLIRSAALLSLGRRPEARVAAAACVVLAAPAGLGRLVREATPEVRRLLEEAARRAGGATEEWYRLAQGRLEEATAAPGAGGLSRREREVLPYLRSDLTAREIGERLFVSEHTVKSHLKAIYVKLDVRSRAGALTRAEELGLLPPSPSAASKGRS